MKDLENVSGNTKYLLKFYENGNDLFYWQEIDDEILRNCKDANDNNLKILIRYKGKENVIERIKFMNIDSPFNFS